MAEPKNRHDPNCEVWTGDGPCSCGTGFTTNHTEEIRRV